MIHLIEDKLPFISALCRKYKVKQLYLFGSACTSGFSKESDIDFLISFDMDKDVSETFAKTLGI